MPAAYGSAGWRSDVAEALLRAWAANPIRSELTFRRGCVSHAQRDKRTAWPVRRASGVNRAVVMDSGALRTGCTHLPWYLECAYLTLRPIYDPMVDKEHPRMRRPERLLVSLTILFASS